MAIESMDECGRCGKTIFPESEETRYCSICKSRFCMNCACLCHENTVERIHTLFQPPPNKKRTKRYRNIQRTETKEL